MEKSDKKEHPCLVLNFREKVSGFLKMSMQLAVLLVVVVGFLYQLEEISLYSWITESCHQEWVMSLASAFICSLSNIIIQFFFSLLKRQITLIDFQMLKLPCILEINLSDHGI